MKNQYQVITAKRMPIPTDELAFKPLSFEDLMFKNRSTAWKMAVTPTTDPAWEPYKIMIDEYNAYLQNIHAVSGLEKFIAERAYCVSYGEISNQYGKEVADKVFSVKAYPFHTRLETTDGYLINYAAAPRFRACIPGFGHFHFSVGDLSVAHAAPHVHKSLLWNWSEDLRDLCYCLLTQLEHDDLFPAKATATSKSYSNYDCYDQHRDNMDSPDKNLLRCAKLLESMGYLTIYKIEPSVDSPWFPIQDDVFGTVATLDWDYRKDALLKEKLRLVLAQPEDEVDINRYFLTDANGKQYVSCHPGKFGGHRELKIYGRLDCSSAKRHIANGNYIRHRVFFADEETAIAAGYRPCGACMKEQFKKWR